MDEPQDKERSEKVWPTAALARAGIQHPYQVLLWVPRTYRDYSKITTARGLHARVGEKIVMKVQVTKRAGIAIDRKTRKPAKGRFTASVMDATNTEHQLMIFGDIRSSPWRAVTAGQTIHIEVTVAEFNGYINLNGADLIPLERVGKIYPVYSGKSGVIGADAVLRAAQFAVDVPRAIEDACISIRQGFAGADEESILAAANLGGSLPMIIENLHRPVSAEMALWAQAAAKRLAVANIMSFAERIGERPLRLQASIRIDRSEVDLALRTLPYAPTRGPRSQEAAIHDIVKMLDEPKKTDAILTADVGVGKTLCYMVPGVLAQKRQAKVAVLVPNTILADSIAQEFKHCFPDVPVALVTDAHKKDVIEWDKNPVLIGTTRLFQVAKKQGWKPNLLVIDEQQKMSAAQRDELCSDNTNVIEASATPLPQTLALLKYGGKRKVEVDVAHAKKIISSSIVFPQDRAEVFRQMREIVAAGEQVAVIYPRVVSAVENDPLSVIEAAKVWEMHFPGNVVTIHGKLSDDAKIEAMRQAKALEKQVIVASSIVEVGVTIPKLRGLMVVSADRYGTSTLHQMRGRLARHGGKGMFWLYLTKDVEEETMSRIQLLEQTSNGFELADLDMKLRGFGTLSEELGVVTESGATRTLFRGINLMPEDLASTKA